MNTSRRRFITHSAALGIASYAAATRAEEVPAASEPSYKLVPIGKIEIKNKVMGIRRLYRWSVGTRPVVAPSSLLLV
jgi:hypothetical protein